MWIPALTEMDWESVENAVRSVAWKTFDCESQNSAVAVAVAVAAGTLCNEILVFGCREGRHMGTFRRGSATPADL